MIKSVTIINYLNEKIVLELGRPDKSGLLIKSIEGLGPSEATINAKEIATSDGALFNSARVNSRNIVLTLGFLFHPTVEDMRQLTYKYFPIKQRLTIRIETDNRIAETYGYVETNEPDIFQKEETTQISIICPDAYFYSAGSDGNNITVFSGIEDAFEFPFSNESLTENLIEFGKIHYSQEQTVYYNGDAEIGIIITIHAINKEKNVTIYNTGTRGIMKIDTEKIEQLTGYGIINGDDIIISTVKKDKYIHLLRNGEYINILNALDKDSEWFQLTKGDNIFAYTAEEGATNLQFKIENRTLYEGV